MAARRQLQDETGLHGPGALIRVDGTAVALLGIADRTRLAVATTVARITAVTGAPPILVTGDNAHRAACGGIVTSGCCPVAL